MRKFLKSALARTPYRIVRRSSLNRFQAIESSLQSLASRGFTPELVVDGGANTGEFTRTALLMFPRSIVHAIEPQPGCQAALQTLRSNHAGRLVVHSVALCSPGHEGGTLRMSTDTASISTGASVSLTPHGLEVPCFMLDHLLEPYSANCKSVFLKLDLQGFELHALSGAIKTLKNTDVVLTEVSFYAQAYEPKISALSAFLAGHGFELYDIASVYARPRDDRPRQGDFIFVRSNSKLAADRAWS